MKWYDEIRDPFGGSDVYTYGGEKVGTSYPGLFGDGQDYYDNNGNYLGSSDDFNNGKIWFPDSNSSD